MSAYWRRFLSLSEYLHCIPLDCRTPVRKTRSSSMRLQSTSESMPSFRQASQEKLPAQSPPDTVAPVGAGDGVLVLSASVLFSPCGVTWATGVRSGSLLACGVTLGGRLVCSVSLGASAWLKVFSTVWLVPHGLPRYSILPLASAHL